MFTLDGVDYFPEQFTTATFRALMEQRRRHSLKRLSSRKKSVGSQQNTKQEEESQIEGVDSFIDNQMNSDRML